MSVRRGVVLVAVLLVGAVGECADPPLPSAVEVRAKIKNLWSKDGNEAAAAITALEGDPLALPVLRVAIATDPDISHRGVLEKLLEKAVAARDAELAKRIEQWAKDSRLDLLTEVRSLTHSKAAEAALTRLVKASDALREAGAAQFATRAPLPPQRTFVFQWTDEVGRKALESAPLFDANLVMNEVDFRQNQVLCGDRVDAPAGRLQQSAVVCRTELKHFGVLRGAGRCQWGGSLLFSNSTVQFEDAGGCVLVIDGDLELAPGAKLENCAVVVNGSVREYGPRPGSKFATSVLWAAGDITLTTPDRPHPECVFIAGGKVANAGKLTADGCVDQNAKEPPLPVRFLDPAADYGLTLEAGKEGMTVAKVAAKSAFAESLKAGDVIAAVTGVKTPTAPAFRHELRRGILEGAVLLDITRGKEKLELLVPVPDVPAVPKKEKKDDPKAKPVEK